MAGKDVIALGDAKQAEGSRRRSAARRRKSHLVGEDAFMLVL